MNKHYVIQIGQRLFQEGLVAGNCGNMSIRSPSGFWITRSESYLDQPGDLVFCPIQGAVPRTASSEYKVHREVYRQTSYRAIVHAHPPHTVALSFGTDEVIPVDTKGKLLCPAIPVVTGEQGTEELAVSVASGLQHAPLVIARGHGTFAAGASLEQGYLLTSLAEYSSKILLMLTPDKG